jgi:hypothetical protein
LGWGITTVSADDRRNTSDFALGIPDSADPDGLYASSVSSEILSPEMDLTRFAGGAPVLDFKYLLRNASIADNVVVELVDSSVTPPALVATLSIIDMFTHDWTEHSPISLNAHTGLPKANLRFRFTSDAADEYEGFKLDSVKVRPTL